CRAPESAAICAAAAATPCAGAPPGASPGRERRRLDRARRPPACRRSRDERRGAPAQPAARRPRTHPREAPGRQRRALVAPVRLGGELASAEEATTVSADPRQVRNPRAVALAAARKLGVNPNALYPQLLDKRRGFLYMERKADPVKASALEQLGLVGLSFTPEERRTYPQGPVASQVLGYAGVDNDGLAGLELGLDRTLTGT